MKAGLLFFLFSIAFWPLAASAQQTEVEMPQQQTNFLRNGVYVEVGGNAYYSSLNYERRFFLKGDPVAVFRVGGSHTVSDYWRTAIIPLEFSLVNGKRNLKFEFGAGITLWKSFDRKAKMREASVGDGGNSGVHPLINMRLGARYDFPEMPCFVRVGFTPFVFNKGEGLPGFQPWGGLSLGYSFGQK